MQTNARAPLLGALHGPLCSWSCRTYTCTVFKVYDSAQRRGTKPNSLHFTKLNIAQLNRLHILNAEKLRLEATPAASNTLSPTSPSPGPVICEKLQEVRSHSSLYLAEKSCLRIIAGSMGFVKTLRWSYSERKTYREFRFGCIHVLPLDLRLPTARQP